MSQLDLLYDLLYDGQPHRTDEIMKVVYGSDHLGVARIAARISDLRKRGVMVKPAWPDKEKPTLYWYQLIKVNFNGVPIDENTNKNTNTNRIIK